MSESHSSTADDGCDEIMLFGVRVKVDPMRKCVSMNDLSEYVHVDVQPTTRDLSSNSNINSNSNNNLDGYVSADDVVPNPSKGGRERKRG